MYEALGILTDVHDVLVSKRKNKNKQKSCTSTRLQSSINDLWCPVSLTNTYGCTHLITINTYITGDKLVKKRRNNKLECRRDEVGF